MCWGRIWHEQLEKYFKIQLTSLRTRQVNDEHNLEHSSLRAYMYICVYNFTTRMWSLRFVSLRIRGLHLELPTGVPDPMVAFRDAYGPKIKLSFLFLFGSSFYPFLNFINWFKLVHPLKVLPLKGYLISGKHGKSV